MISYTVLFLVHGVQHQMYCQGKVWQETVKEVGTWCCTPCSWNLIASWQSIYWKVMIITMMCDFCIIPGDAFLPVPGDNLSRVLHHFMALTSKVQPNLLLCIHRCSALTGCGAKWWVSQVLSNSTLHENLSAHNKMNKYLDIFLHQCFIFSLVLFFRDNRLCRNSAVTVESKLWYPHLSGFHKLFSAGFSSHHLVIVMLGILEN